MSKVHISLVGGQPAPVLYCIQEDRPDIVHLVYSNESRNNLAVIKKEISGCEVRETLLDAVDPTKIHTAANELKQEYSGDQVVLNISSGTKSWAFFFSTILGSCENCTVVYFDQNNTLWNYSTLKGHRVGLFDLEKHFRLYGTPLEDNYTNFSLYTKEDYDTATSIREFRRNTDLGVFNSLTTVLDTGWKTALENKQSDLFEVDMDNYVEWNKELGDGRQLIRISMPRKGTMELNSPHAVSLLFNTGWYEYLVAREISLWDKSRDILLNCKFKSTSQHNLDKNEVDIIFRTDNRIFFVECKTSLHNGTDIDKFRATCRKYGGTSCIGLLVVDSRISNANKEKCSDNGIEYFSFTEAKKHQETLQKKLQSIAERLNI